jgi:hypothetical protein
VLARGFDQGVEQGDDGPPQDVGDALVDAGVEGGWVGRGRVFHRLCARQVLHVEEVHTHLTCDFAERVRDWIPLKFLKDLSSSPVSSR